MIWYLLIFGYAYHTSMKIAEPSRAVCIQQAEAFDAWMQRHMGLSEAGEDASTNAFCVQGLPEQR